MIGRRLPDWDLDVTSGRPQMLSGIEYAAQKIRQRLQLLKGEWFADRKLGFPLRQEVLIKNPRLELIRALYAREILAVPGIVRITRLDLRLDPVTRTLSGSWAAKYLDAGTSAELTGEV